MRRRECPPKATPTASPSIPPAVGGRLRSSAGRDIGRESRLCVSRVHGGAIGFCVWQTRAVRSSIDSVPSERLAHGTSFKPTLKKLRDR